MGSTKINKRLISPVDAANLSPDSVGSSQLIDHSTEGQDLNQNVAGDGLIYDSNTDNLKAYVDGTHVIINPSKQITVSPSVKYQSLGIFSYFNNGTPYYRSGTTKGIFTIGYFLFPGTDAVGTPAKFTFVGNIEATSTSAHYIEMYDQINGNLLSRIQINTAGFVSLGAYSTTNVNNLPSSPTVVAVRYNIAGGGRNIRVSSAVFEW